MPFKSARQRRAFYAAKGYDNKVREKAYIAGLRKRAEEREHDKLLKRDKLLSRDNKIMIKEVGTDIRYLEPTKKKRT